MVFMMNKFPGLYLTVGWVLLQRLSSMSNSCLDVARGIAVFTSVKHGIKGMNCKEFISLGIQIYCMQGRGASPVEGISLGKME